MDQAEFKSSRTSNILMGLGLIGLAGLIIWLPLYMSEEEFLNTRVRRGGGLIKMIEQTIGWELFSKLMLLFGVWCFVYGVVSLWKFFNTSADVTAFSDHIEFHPAVRRSSATYNDISHWRIEFVNGHPVLWLHFHEAHWSLQGLFKRKTIKLEGDKDQLSPLVEFFSQHHEMKGKFSEQ